VPVRSTAEPHAAAEPPQVCRTPHAWSLTAALSKPHDSLLCCLLLFATAGASRVQNCLNHHSPEIAKGIHYSRLGGLAVAGWPRAVHIVAHQAFVAVHIQGRPYLVLCRSP
jgi:hypothetical protein